MAPAAFAKTVRTQAEVSQANRPTQAAEASQADRHTLTAEAPSQAEPDQEVHTQVDSQEAHVQVVSLVVHTLVEAHTVEVHTVVDHMVVAEVTSEATDKKGYSSSVRTSAFDIL